jgi:hypothetical protein
MQDYIIKVFKYVVNHLLTRLPINRISENVMNILKFRGIDFNSKYLMNVDFSQVFILSTACCDLVLLQPILPLLILNQINFSFIYS